MQSPEIQAKLAIWRQKTAEGTMTPADYAAAIAEIRGDRKNAANASEQSKRKKAQTVVLDSKSLLADLASLKKPA